MISRPRKKLLAEAGYPNGFEVEMDCPNDRYVNDEAICQAVTQMQSRIGIKVTAQLHAEGEVLREGGRRQEVRFLLQPAGLDAGLVRQLERDREYHRLPRCRRQGRGLFNYGGYCNPKIQELNKVILVETDTAKRDEMIAEAFRINHEEAGVIPLHQQALAWGVSKKVKIVQRADNQILLYWVTMQ